MPVVFRTLICVVALSLAFAAGAARAEDAGTAQPVRLAQAAKPAEAAAVTPPTDVASALAPEDWSGPLGIAAKKPVFAGACKLCPWGQLAIVTKQALAYYGYDVHICWSCATSIGVRDMGDKATTQQDFPAEGSAFRPYVEKVPPEIPDISATNESNLVDAWNGTGQFAADKKKRQNYRIIATVLSPGYLTVAVNKNSGITDLAQLKTRRATWVAAAENDPVLAYYGITKAVLEANGGGLISTNAKRELRGAADVWIGNGMLVNTYEQRMWYEITQMNDLNYLTLPDALLDKLAQSPGYVRAVMPFGYFRGQEHAIPTVERAGGTAIYVRDEAPNAFAYAVAKALDEHRALFRYQVSPWYYDAATVAKSQIPLHPGAIKYYRERGYIK